jgi:hypothetical protein
VLCEHEEVDEQLSLHSSAHSSPVFMIARKELVVRVLASRPPPSVGDARWPRLRGGGDGGARCFYF